MSDQNLKTADFVTTLFELLREMMRRIMEPEPGEGTESIKQLLNSEIGIRPGPATNPLLLYRVSHALSLQPPPTQAQLTHALGLPKATTSRVVNQWVELGLAVRHTDPDDRRYVRVAFTEDGQKLLRVMEKYVAEHADRLLSFLSLNEQETLVVLMRKLQVGLQRTSAEEISE